MEQAIQIIQTLGFPIAVVIFLGFFCWKFIIRIMDENKERETCYRDMLTNYGEKMAEISEALAEIKNDMGDVKRTVAEHNVK